MRKHCRIGNRLHWSLDMSFNEDQCRVHQAHATQGFFRLRRIAFNLLREDKILKVKGRGPADLALALQRSLI